MSDLKKSANDFIFNEIIGEGSFSTVYLAKEVNRLEETKFAIKVCEKKLIRREKKSLAVLREKKCLHILTTNPSPFFIKLFCTFQDQNRLFFVMNFAKNGELLSLINDREVFDINCVRFYSGEILLALEHLHKLAIVHRDLKPENILLNEKMHIQVTDFGSALILNDNDTNISQSNEEQSHSKRKNSFVGTAHYVSPEMLTNKSATASSDLWAFACILYQMICGSTPFRAPNEYLIFQKIINLEFDFNKDFSESAKSLIKNILKLEPKHRLGANDDIHINGYVSIKNEPFFGLLADKWSLLHETTPPFSQSFSKNSKKDEINKKIVVSEDLEPGLAERQITRIMGLQLHDDFEKINIEVKKGILDITPQEMNERLKTQRENNIFHRFVEENLILKQGLIDKKKGLFARRRMFLLTTGPHLYYVDAHNMVLKGQVPWSKDMRPEAKNFKNFFIHTPNRTYLLEDTSGDAPEWCRVIEEVRERTFGNSSEHISNTSNNLCNTNNVSLRKISQNDKKLR